MKKRIFILTLLIGYCAVVNTVLGAAITMADLPYLCDFENETENANWVLNPSINTISTANQWVIGKAVSYTGQYSMYVSQDGGETQTYASANNVLLAYRDITLEAGDYDIAYDWMGLGNKTKGYLKVIYANRPTSGLKCVGNATEPSYVATSVQLMGSNASLVDGDAWRHVQARVTIPVAQANKTTTRLLFVWVNTDVTVKDSITSVAVDNFQLAKASSTGYPSNIHVSTVLGTSTVSWEGNAESYEVMYRKKGDSEFQSLPVTGNTVTLTDVEYGAYEFWICCVNGEDKSVYTVFPTVYLYETDCFDALNMYNAEFEYGTWNRNGKTVKGSERIDYGPGDIRSRHTTHFDLSEVDPRTVIKNSRGDTTYCLKTVPKGEFGSVRLGNWNTGSEYESMTFHYTVESSSMAVLLIHYAMVLENPNHTAQDQPRFTLDVLDEAGNPIDRQCASVDFHAPTSDEWDDPSVRDIWHQLTYYDNAGGSGRLINWQEWKTIGISMEDYVGQTLTITLTAYDCDQGGHFGYCYFMLNCSRSDVDGLPWGDGATTRMFTAPEGFDYAWFNRTDTELKDTIDNTNPNVRPYITEGGRFFYVHESDTNTYLCHVTYPTNKECGYWFDASAKPHNPKAEMEFLWKPENCRNGYVWWNRCHVMLTNQETGDIEHRYDKHLESCFLLTEEGLEVPVKYAEEGFYVPMPDEGGIVRYGIWTGIYVNDKLFADTAWYEFEVPAIGELETHLFDSICRGGSIIFPAGSRNKYTEPGEYHDSLKSVITGCDSIVKMHLHVHEPIEMDVYDTICPGGSYSFNGKTYYTSGRYTGLFVSQVTGCDSVVTLYLTLAPKPSVSLVADRLCSDQPLIFAIHNGFYVDSMRVREGEWIDTTTAIRRDGAEMIIPLTNKDVGQHGAVVSLSMPWCETVYTDTMYYSVSLSNRIIELHWDDVLVFLAPAYNGGLTFNSYQWYANGELIPGAVQSWYYDPDMKMDTEYQVRVTLPDGAEAWVCPFTPAQAGGLTNSGQAPANEQKSIKLLRNGNLRIIHNEKEYNAQGQLVY